MIITVQQYRDDTGDVASAAEEIEYYLADAIEIVEGYLGRTLTYGTYTERMKIWPRGFAYPAAVPVVSVASTGLTNGNARVYDDATLWMMEADPVDAWTPVDWDHFDHIHTFGEPVLMGYEVDRPYGTVTYTGGWTSDTLPALLRKYICRLVKGLVTGVPESGALPGGATSARVGDVQVSLPRPATPDAMAAFMDAYVPGMTMLLKRWKLSRT